MPRATGPRKLVWVTPSASLSDVKYGFLTNITGADAATLGHTDVVRGTLLAGLIIGCNNMKPARATKKRSTGTISSFLDHEARAAALAANFKIMPGKNRGRRSSTLSKAVYATVNGVKIGVRVPPLTTGSFSDLGLTETTPTDLDVFFGCRMPKLPRATMALSNGGSQSSVYDPTITLPAGWDPLTEGKLIPG